MKFIYNLFLIISIISFISCLFDNSKNVKKLAKIEDIDVYLSNTNITIGMMLVFSDYCGHCHTFGETYEKLAEKYKDKLLFFAMSVYSNYHKRMPSTDGIPYILFLSDGYFYKYKRRRSFEDISYAIDHFYLTRCREITYKNIENVYYNVFLNNKDKYNNLIIGYFDDNSNENIENFKKSNNLMCPECVGLCYICKDFKDNKDTNNTIFEYIKSNIIVGYLQNNNSKVFIWENEKEKNINKTELEIYKNNLIENNITIKDLNIISFKNYDNFINNELKLEYFNIENKKEEYLINFLRNKNNIIFAYTDNSEKDLYINNINELVNITDKKIFSLYNLVLYKHLEFQNNTLWNITSNGIYQIDDNFKKTKKYKKIEILKNKLIREYNLTKDKHDHNYKPLIPELNEDEKNSFENQNSNEDESFLADIFFKLLEKICVVLFTIVFTFALFFTLHYKYYNNVNMEQIELARHSMNISK